MEGVRDGFGRLQIRCDDPIDLLACGADWGRFALLDQRADSMPHKVGVRSAVCHLDASSHGPCAIPDLLRGRSGP